MIKILAWITDHLVYLVFVIGAFSLLFPGPGSLLGWIVTPVLALMVLSVSMTINVTDLIQASRYPLIIIWSIILQFVVMALFSIMLGKIFFSHMPDLNTGQILLGSLPADISAPLMISLVGGNTALGMTMLVTAMVLTPFVLPNVLTLFGGITLQVPTVYLEAELVGIIIIPLVIGLLLNHYSAKVRENRDAWPGFAALCYILLLFVVVSSNAVSIISLKEFAVVIIIVELSLNLFGYGLACLTKIVFKQTKATFLPLLFIASTKEFGIAPAAMDTMELNRAIVIPSAFYAVVQMISSPVMVKVVKRLEPVEPIDEKCSCT
ncbi:MAG: bile acid:sodium symporter [Methanoregula sp.]|uniref:bile acid:sodium symporter family protein n=2 Tax=Methanoregula sp. TaxID=2052170 RepID=UPI003BB1C04A